MDTPLPHFLESFQSAATEYLRHHPVKEIQFARNTYQIQLFDPGTGTDFWVFIQLDFENKLKDFFCTCENEQMEQGCVHIAIAWQIIYREHSKPLHKRFEESFWNSIFWLYAQQWGNDPDALTPNRSGEYVLKSSKGESLFVLKGKGLPAKAKLASLLEERLEENEENSIKFSGLNHDELISWKEGNASDQLQYELSFWHDLAQLFMVLQDQSQRYHTTFLYGKDQLPAGIQIDFPEFFVEFSLSRHDLEQIIPTLETINSPLKIHYLPNNQIKQITYDKFTKKMHVEIKKSSKEQKEKLIEANSQSISLGSWLYLPNKGFFSSKENQLFTQTEWDENDIANYLEKYASMISPLLKNAKLHDEIKSLSYQIEFDIADNLSIKAYLYTPGDLSDGISHFFEQWVYKIDDGFYKVIGAHFPEIETMIHKEELSDFIRHERSWLNAQEGFHVHLVGLETGYAYRMNEDKSLIFTSQLQTNKNRTTKDLGSWIYVKKEGFYAKTSTIMPLQIDFNRAIPSHQIPWFIRINREALQLIPHFFNEKSPIKNTGINLVLQANERLYISPQYELDPEYKDKAVLFFEEFIYVPNEGFSELPIKHRLPQKLRHPFEIPKEQIHIFFSYEFEEIKPYLISVDPRLVEPIDIQLKIIKIEEDRISPEKYALKVGYQTEKGFISAAFIWDAMQEKRTFLFCEAGRLDLSNNRFDWIKSLDKKSVNRRKQMISLNVLELIRLISFENCTTEDEKTHQYLENLKTGKEIPEPSLKGLKSSLRPYQEIGVKWLWSLYCRRLSGLLCDEMGLGKTHQAMGLLAAIDNQAENRRTPHLQSPIRSRFLIVCPTSVIYHWQEKLAEHLPKLSVRTFYGITRSLNEMLATGDIILTSYGIVRLEFENLKKIPFEVAIFDEIQIAKNQHSRVHHALLSIKAFIKVGLTGTPIENYLRELKALFDLVLPKYMPSEKHYKNLFVRPIEQFGDPVQKKLLNRLIQPFSLRRKKKEVLADLPEKIEEVIHCSFLPQQEYLYQQVLLRGRQPLLQKLEDSDEPIPYMHIFALLSSLKQICNHPAAYLKCPQDYKEYESGKWELFIELLNEARESNQKIVVFSQYLAMLDIFAFYFKEQGIDYAEIRGSTTNRGDQVSRFNKDPACEVFIGSLQASGLGIDLTAGTVVILYDRWWNAAREDQAVDRVHRIGQTRGVQVFKIITKDSFEERIDFLITKKRKLLESIVEADDHRILKQFSREEIVQLLQELPTTLLHN